MNCVADGWEIPTTGVTVEVAKFKNAIVEKLAGVGPTWFRSCAENVVP
mgnify:CR=1 FL=1